MGWEIVIVIIAMVVLIITLSGIFTWHTQEMAKRRGDTLNKADRATLEDIRREIAELRELKSQITELRDTTTRYDMSFDTALQRLETRMTNMEQRVKSAEREGEMAQAHRS